ncbi:MAG: class I SAM-dependent methyltransferase [Cytophagaceae bacterium]
MEYYKIKEQDYFTEVRIELVRLIPKGTEKLLEIGAGGGNTIFYIKEKAIAKEVHGIDIIALPDTFQNNPLIDKFYINNIENESFDLQESYFDCIICGDVLEHLVDPWKAVQKIQRWLKPGGTLIVSIPNFREIGALKKIIFDKDFGYTSSGIFDKTHLRFFCKKNALDLLSTSQLRPVNCLHGFIAHDGYKKRKMINFVTLGILKDWLTPQYFIICKRN